MESKSNTGVVLATSYFSVHPLSEDYSRPLLLVLLWAACKVQGMIRGRYVMYAYVVQLTWQQQQSAKMKRSVIKSCMGVTSTSSVQTTDVMAYRNVVEYVCFCDWQMTSHRMSVRRWPDGFCCKSSGIGVHMWWSCHINNVWWSLRLQQLCKGMLCCL